MKLNKIFSQNNIWLSLIAIVAVFLLVPNISLAFPDSLGEFVGGIIFYVLFSPFIALFELEMWILPSIAQFNNFTKLPGVITGWTVLRDLSNMFFIVVLLVMAFGTILKMQSYGYKDLLKTLIIMAILINFSKTIAGFLIDIGQVVMLTFVSAIKDVAAGNLTAMFGIDKMVQIGVDQSGNPKEINSFSGIVLAYLLGGIMMMLVTIVLMAFIVMLVMRIVFLWILVVLSPLAFLANTFPATKRYFSEWFGNLTKEIIVGPVLIFFLWLSLTILNGNVKEELTKAKSAEVQAQQGRESVISADADIGFTEAGKWDNVVMFIVALGMLIGSLKVTQKMGSSAMAYGTKAADKLKSGINAVDKKFGAQRQAKNILVGSTGEGGLKLGAQRLGTFMAAPALMGVGKVLSPIGGGFVYRTGAKMEGRKDKAMGRKQAKLEENAADVRDENKQQYWESRGGSYSKRALDKIQVGKKNKLKEMAPEEVKEKVVRARAVNDVDTLTKLQNAHAVANTEADLQAAHDRGEGLQRHQNMNMEGTFERDENDQIIVPKDKESDGYKKGQLVAKSLLRLDGKQQMQALNSMEESSRDAMIEHIKDLDTGAITALQEALKQTSFKTKPVYTEVDGDEPDLGKDGKEQTNADGTVKMKKVIKTTYEQEADMSTAEAQRVAILTRFRSGAPETKAAYDSLQASVKQDVANAKGEKAKFDESSIARAIQNGLEGVDLAKMNAASPMFKELAKYFSMAKISAMHSAGASSAHLKTATEIKANYAMDEHKKNPNSTKATNLLADIKRLLASSLTRSHVPEAVRSYVERVAPGTLKETSLGAGEDNTTTAPSGSAAPAAAPASPPPGATK